MGEKELRDEVRLLGVVGAEAIHGTGNHSLTIINREQVSLQGVLAVDSFDDEEIIMETEMGTLTLRGEELHIKQLDLETGRLAVDGFVNACIYTAPRQRGGRPAKGRGFLERLLR
jgi:sporulation protein YabP